MLALTKRRHKNYYIYLPWWLVISINCIAILAPFSAPSTTLSGGPTNVYTVLLVDTPGSTSRREQPSTEAMACAMASITSLFRPSEKFGTHSTIWAMILTRTIWEYRRSNPNTAESTSFDSIFVRFFKAFLRRSYRSRNHVSRETGEETILKKMAL